MRCFALLVGLLAAGASAVAVAFPDSDQLPTCEQLCNAEYAGCMAPCSGNIACIPFCTKHTCEIDQCALCWANCQ